MKNLLNNLRLLLILSIFSVVSCSTKNDPGNCSAYIELDELLAEGGVAQIIYSANVGSTWRAGLTSTDDFASFSASWEQTLIGGDVESAGDNTLSFYYEQNSAAISRDLTVTFEFYGADPIEFTITQPSSISDQGPYDSSGEPRWSEIPEQQVQDNYIYVTHSVSLSGSQVRNYSLCYDTTNRAAAWVAYPFHSCYDGNVGRNEEWTYDPKIPTDYQPNLYRSYSDFGDDSFDRGHQIPSNDRQATVAMNEQTFYYSNMTPQLSTLNQQKWASLELDVNSQVCIDTLYVVTGADFTTTLGTVTDYDGVASPLPGAYYKVLLRTRSGNSGKAVTQCSADELQAIGFWMEHRYYDAIPEPVSVKYIEEKTGFDFFPGVPSEVKESFDEALWSF